METPKLFNKQNASDKIACVPQCCAGRVVRTGGRSGGTRMSVQVVQHFQNLFDDDACAHDESMDINSKALFEEHLVDSKIAGLSPEFTKLGAPLACSRLLYRVGH